MENQKNIKSLLGGTSNYITEYILMLISHVAAVASLCGVVFAVFGMLANDRYSVVDGAAAMTASALVIIFTPLYLVLNRRVSAQEQKDHSVVKSRSRTVFLTIASVAAFGWFIGFSATALYHLFSPIFVKTTDYGMGFVSTFLPALISAGIIGASLVQLHKHVGTQFRKRYLALLPIVALIILGTTFITAAVKKNDSSNKNVDCTWSNYKDGECSLDDYYEYIDNRNNNYRKDDYMYNNSYDY